MAAPHSRRIAMRCLWLPLFLALSARLVYGGGFSATGFGLAGIKGHIGCFGDFNSDKRTDVFVISDDFKSVQVYFWTHDGYVPSSAKVSMTTGSILSVIASDYNYDGRLDVAIYGRTDASTYYLDIFLGHLTSFDPTAIVQLSNLKDQPLLWDFNGDMKVDFLAKTDSTSARTVFTSSVSDQGVPAFTSSSLPNVPGSASPLSTPHSNAFIDLNGDCVADLFLSTMDSSNNPFFEVWINNPAAGSNDPKFTLFATYPGPKGAGQVSFMDVDADGTIDAVFPVCWPADTCATENSVHILYNPQGDRSSDNLCTGQDPGFQSDWSSSNITSRHVIVQSSAFGPNIRFATGTLTSDSATQVPVTARLGDADMDGFPDALLLVRRTTSISPADGTISPESYFQLWMNVPCTEALCGIDALNAGRRTFSYSQQGKSNLESATGAFAAAWVDLSDNGQLDLIILSSKNGNRTMTAWENSFDEDAYFLTSLGLNGVCNAWCSSGEKFPDPKPYGVNMPGITTKFTVTSLSGSRDPRVGGQLPQSAYLSLQTPYTYFGIGRTNNYIEYFYMGTPSHPREVGSWVAIIPNSQLILFPYPLDDPLNWTLELFISPSASMALVAGSLGVTLFVLGATIVYFHVKEKKEDELDKQTEQLIAF